MKMHCENGDFLKTAIIYLILPILLSHQLETIQGVVICYCNAPSCISSNYMCKSEKECYSQIVYKSLQEFLLNRNANHLYGCVEGIKLTPPQSTTDVAAPVLREDWYTLNYFCSSDLCNTLKGGSQQHLKPTHHKLREPTMGATAPSDEPFVMVSEQGSTSTLLHKSYLDQSVPGDLKGEIAEGHSSSVNVTPATTLASPWRLRTLVIVLAIVGIVMIAGLVYMAHLIMNKSSSPYHAMTNKKVVNSFGDDQSFYVTISSQHNLVVDGDERGNHPCPEQILVLRENDGDDSCTKYLLFPIHDLGRGL